MHRNAPWDQRRPDGPDPRRPQRSGPPWELEHPGPPWEEHSDEFWPERRDQRESERPDEFWPEHRDQRGSGRLDERGRERPEDDWRERPDDRWPERPDERWPEDPDEHERERPGQRRRERPQERESERPDQRRLERLVVGVTAVVLALGGILTIVVSAPYEIRFPLVALASLIGPAIPAMMLYSGLSLTECLVYGAGVNVALLMVISLGMVLAHAFSPDIAMVALLLASVAAGGRLIMADKRV